PGGARRHGRARRLRLPARVRGGRRAGPESGVRAQQVVAGRRRRLRLRLRLHVRRLDDQDQAPARAPRRLAARHGAVQRAALAAAGPADPPPPARGPLASDRRRARPPRPSPGVPHVVVWHQPGGGVVVRDHRGGAPEVRDHRTQPAPAYTPQSSQQRQVVLTKTASAVTALRDTQLLTLDAKALQISTADQNQGAQGPNPMDTYNVLEEMAADSIDANDVAGINPLL